jgi:hypothetical protein
MRKGIDQTRRWSSRESELHADPEFFPSALYGRCANCTLHINKNPHAFDKQFQCSLGSVFTQIRRAIDIITTHLPNSSSVRGTSATQCLTKLDLPPPQSRTGLSVPPRCQINLSPRVRPTQTCSHVRRNLGPGTTTPENTSAWSGDDDDDAGRHGHGATSSAEVDW